MSALTIPVTFLAEADARHFVKRLTLVLKCPTFRQDRHVLAVIPLEEIAALKELAVECHGTVRYDP